MKGRIEFKVLAVWLLLLAFAAVGTPAVAAAENDVVILDPQHIVPVTGVAVNTEKMDMCPGDTATLTARVLPDESVHQGVVWQSSNTEVAVVDGGIVTAIAGGTAVVTVTTQEGAWSTVCSVTVKDATLATNMYDLKDGTLRGVTAPTSANRLKSGFDNDAGDLYIVDRAGNAYTGRAVGTGMSLKLMVGGIERDMCTIVVTGDVSGGGSVSIQDGLLLQRHLLADAGLEDVYASAGDYNGDNRLTVADYALMRLEIPGASDPDGGLADLRAVSDPRINALLDAALAQLDKPYVWGAEGPDSYDCSGLIHDSLGKAGYAVERLTADMYSRLKEWNYVDKHELQPGDLMFYFSDDPDDGDRIGHTGIYLGDGLHVHASSDSRRVIISRMEGWYEKMLSHGRRVF